MPRFYVTLRTLFLRNEKLSTASLGGLLLLSLVLMGIASLALLNDKAIKGYSLNKLEEERQTLVSDGEITEMLMLRARSMDEVASRSQGMVKPDTESITYVVPVTVVASTREPAYE